MEGHPIKTAGMLVIGDEVLNGKIKDTNSQFFAEYCFELGINLRRISVVPDEESDIVETLNTMRNKYDFIVTTGGIGPTHDDITYESIAKAFELPLELDNKTVDRMNELAKFKPKDKKPNSVELHAQLRMATFPSGPNVNVDFVSDKLWVPAVNLNQQVYIFPGIPTLYRQMMEGLKSSISKRVDGPKLTRRYVSTTTVESVLASTLSDIHHRFQDLGIKIGSYPHFRDHKNTVSILGPQEHADVLQQIVDELLPKLDNSREVSAEEEAASR